MVKKCLDCGCEIVVNSSNHVRCSNCSKKREQDRRTELNRQYRANELKKDKICTVCGCIFHSVHSSSKYCSQKCSASKREKKEDIQPVVVKAYSKDNPVDQFLARANKKHLTYAELQYQEYKNTLKIKKKVGNYERVGSRYSKEVCG